MASNHRPSFVRAARRIPGLRKMPAVQLAAIAEVALLTRNHVQMLTPGERRRVLQLVRAARGRPRNLTDREREELAQLVEKAEPRRLAGEAIDALSPVRLPGRMVYGRRGRTR
jgi:hypothetical protein